MIKTIRTMKAEFKIATNCSMTNITAELQAENVVVLVALQPILFEMLDNMKTISRVIRLITRHHELQKNSLFV